MKNKNGEEDKRQTPHRSQTPRRRRRS
ncbi:unnamed protein product [Ectocarpus sp. CCAP 1310/34]|nr:unnamed protein product [Ectocarpus sp. CCAP 1310/34]